MDRISELPEPLITQILSYLPSKDSVRTSALSSKWKTHWLNVPILILADNDFPFRDQVMFITFLDKFLDFNPKFQTVKLSSRCLEINGLKDRIVTVINRGVQHLDVTSSVYFLGVERVYPFIDIMPLNLYTSKALVSLKLSLSGLGDPGFVFLPCLKLMHLVKIRWVATMTLGKLLSGCPVLEELILLRDIRPEFEDFNQLSMVTCVRSGSLKRFYVPRKRDFPFGPRLEYILEIDAPGLEFMSLKEDQYDKIVVKSLNSLFTIDLDIKFAFGSGIVFNPPNLSKRNEIREFLFGITSVLFLYSRVAPIPKFNNLSCLQAVFSSIVLPFLPTILESCPNLKHLTLELGDAENMDTLDLISVPQCFLSTLECVEIKGMFKWKEKEKNIASYFLDNSSVLKKLILNFRDHTYPRGVSDSYIYKELSQLTKCSWGCRIIIGYER